MSLIEVLVVVTIIGMITGIVGVTVFGVMRTSKIQTAETQITNIRNAMEMYRLRFHRYPTTTEGIAVLESPPRGDRIMKAIPEDPWGKEYLFRSPGAKDPKGFDLYSMGPDNQPDTDDDVW